MIKLTRLNGSEIVINAELIETIEATPDTVISLTTGKKFVVHEPVNEVIEQAVAYYTRTRGGGNRRRRPATRVDGPEQ
ncbi:MAG: flagellar FlbD family protein [Armatimonadota bacterium]|nr:flagellar FlbD family protein [Armatimonadota bacterium]